MTTFAKSTFNASVYSASRPTYPSQLFDRIFAFHGLGVSSNSQKRLKPRWERAVDVGCGTGQATAELKGFNEVIGIDPSLGMLEKAEAYVRGRPNQNRDFRFLEGSAEDMTKAIPEPGSVDLLIAAQAAHWFDWDEVWPETRRVLRSGGTAAFWIYAEFRLPQFPSLTPKITAYAQGNDPRTSLGPHFQRPGRTYLERYLIDVPEPADTMRDSRLTPLERVYYISKDSIPPLIAGSPNIHPPIMQTEMRWRDLLAYFRTWSSLYTFHEKYPEDLKREEDTRFLELQSPVTQENETARSQTRGGDIAIRFWNDLREGAASYNADVHEDAKVMVEWPIALIMTHKL